MLPTKYFKFGEAARLSVAITEIAGTPFDPAALRLLVRDPSGTLTTYTYGIDAEIVREAAGRYRCDLVLPIAGMWFYRWESDAPNPGADEGRLAVQRSLVA